MNDRLKGLNVMVTGGAGFIGSEVVRQLRDVGAKVTVVDNLANGKRENLAGIEGPECTLAATDIRDTDEMARLMRDVSLVLHMACLGVRHSIHSPVENHEVNATATLDLLRLARESGVSRFLYCSSSEVYGTATTVPMVEEHPTYPMTVYGASKLAGECYTRAYNRTYGLPTVVVRPFNTYGPRSHHEGDSGEVIPKFVLRCMAGRPMVVFGDGSQTRDFTFVSDTARGLIQAALSDELIGETINLGQGAEIAIKDLAIEIARVLNRSDAAIRFEEQRPGDVLRLYANIDKARARLNYRPSVGLNEGLQKLCSWYRGLGVSAETLLEAEQVHNWKAA